MKDIDASQQSKGIDDGSTGRAILFWGPIKQSGVGLCFARLGWGEYALLPTKYEPLLYPTAG